VPGIPALGLHGFAVLVGVVVALAVMARERVPITVSSLGIIATLSLAFEVFPFEGPRGRLGGADFFAGFGHEALVAICALMVLGRGLVMTGALEPLARALAAIWQHSRLLAMLAVLMACITLSGVLNDTPIVVLMTPVLMSLAARTGTTPGPLLMPMNFAVLIGGMATTIGTSTNLLVVSLAADLGVRRFGLFEFTPLVMMAALPALVYLLAVAPRLLRHAGRPAEAAPPREYHAVLRVPPGSAADGLALAEVLQKSARIHVRAIQDNGGLMLARLPTTRIIAGMRLYLRGTTAELKECEAVLGGQLHADDDTGFGAVAQPVDKDDEVQLVEMIVSADSGLVGRRLGDLRFTGRYGLLMLGIHREQDVPSDPDIRHWLVHPGDVLLVQGPSRQVDGARRDGEMLALDGSVSLPRTSKAPVAIGIMLAVVATAATGAVPIAVAAVLGAVAMLLTQCVLPRNLGKAVSAEVVLLIPASLALGKALTVTGGADWIAALLLRLVHDFPVALVLAGIIALMSLLTNFISNNAAAVIGTPIAVAVARELGLSPEPFALAVLFGCNLCFATPIGYQTNLIVMSAAGYGFRDFIKAGLPLTLLMIGTCSWLLPRWYGL
jgi:di/tricarboxylate transporter